MKYIGQSQRHETPRCNYNTKLVLRKYNWCSIAIRHFRVLIVTESMSSLGSISPTYTSLLQTPIPTMFRSLRMKRFLIHCANVLLTSLSCIPRYHILQLSLQRDFEFNAYYDATMFSSYLTACSIAIFGKFGNYLFGLRTGRAIKLHKRGRDFRVLKKKKRDCQ